MNKLLIIGISILSFSCQTKEAVNSLSSHNEDDTLMVFAPELAIEGNTYKGSFSDDLNTFYFFRKDTIGSNFIPYRSNFNDGKWSPAEIVGYYDKQYSYTYQLKIPNTDQLLFISNMRTANDSSNYPNYNFWSISKSGDKWSDPKEFGSEKVTDNYNSQPSITNSGTIYFSSFTRDYRHQYPYKMEKIDGNYTEANIFEPVEKWRKSGKWKIGPFAMDPDENFMILTINEADQSNDDLYISYAKDGNWTAPTKLNNSVNTAQKEGFPYLTPDGKYLIFTRAKSQFYIVPTKQIHIKS